MSGLLERIRSKLGDDAAVLWDRDVAATFDFILSIEPFSPLFLGQHDLTERNSVTAQGWTVAQWSADHWIVRKIVGDHLENYFDFAGLII